MTIIKLWAVFSKKWKYLLNFTQGGNIDNIYKTDGCQFCVNFEIISWVLDTSVL